MQTTSGGDRLRGARCGALRASILLALASSSSAGLAQNVLPESDRARLERELQQLLEMRRSMTEQMSEFDRRIQAVEAELRARAVPEVAQPRAPVEPAPAVAAAAPAAEGVAAAPKAWGAYEPGRGFVAVRNETGELDWSLFTYARYLNQKGLENTYTDSFGRTSRLDLRNDLQLAKATLTFKGWLFDERFRYVTFVWTSNTSQGDPAQVVVAGNLSYTFSDHLALAAGIGALPTTRSTAGTFPNWLRNDHRTIADEFFRGSYTTGFWASGSLLPGLEYKMMLGNNLSQLGINAPQLDGNFNTFATSLSWMPTTGEYGPLEGFGDYEFHQDLATFLAANYTRSREDAQGQPDTEGFENTQLRLSDGTLIFRLDPFASGGSIRKASYEMFALSAGLKYLGWSLDAEYYHRTLDNFATLGVIPVTSVTDQGFQVQASAMLVPRKLQAYVSGSKIFGDYGDPYDLALGLNWFPLVRREMRLSFQGLYLKNSPVGYSSVPMAVGGNGWVFTMDTILAF